ncbi:hypothetical protein BOX15_Mlig010991g3 [Macrostomum lignano]|uniref:PurE domain-containing protein n=1 Tax=Macrostomum lignano TaxID=282301 RepID=A0A267GYU7_9PLAT|nr:hypothetical protein BOX15_Mlig010991g3 [Macrostomum lignano]
MEINKDEKLSEGKTKIIYSVKGQPGLCVMHAKERITANNAAKVNELAGKAAVSNKTTALVFEYLKRAGIRCAFERILDDICLLSRRCHMIPIEFVCRRVATGSFLKRHPGVPEGHRFVPVKSETFFKDDANDDPQVSKEQIVAMGLNCGSRKITGNDVDILEGTTAAVFEILERAWHSLDCALIDMKVEYGVDAETGEILLADVIDSDSWRLWPGGDKRLMVDKQVYRDMAEVTDDGLRAVLRNFQWVADKLPAVLSSPKGRVIIAMGSATDADYCKSIAAELRKLGVEQVDIRVCSAHKATRFALEVGALASDPARGPTAVIAVAGRSNGLGPVLSGNLCAPVINAPPVSADWAGWDLGSSLRMPSGLGCVTVLGANAAALAAAQILATGVTEHSVWARLRAAQLTAWVRVLRDDERLQESVNKSQ